MGHGEIFSKDSGYLKMFSIMIDCNLPQFPISGDQIMNKQKKSSASTEDFLQRGRFYLK